MAVELQVPIIFVAVEGASWNGKQRPDASDVPEEISEGGNTLRPCDAFAKVMAKNSGRMLEHSRAYFEAFVEELVGKNRDARFCVGSHLTVADLCLVPQLYNARRFDVDLGAYPQCVAVEAHLATLPPFVAAHPDAQPDAAKK